MSQTEDFPYKDKAVNEEEKLCYNIPDRAFKFGPKGQTQFS